MTIADARVKVAYEAWEESRRDLAAMELLLQAAMQQHATGGPLPLAIIGEVNSLRSRTDRLFSVALEAMGSRGSDVPITTDHSFRVLMSRDQERAPPDTDLGDRGKPS
jgi:hypothetical protein